MIIETWEVKTLRVDNSIVEYKEETCQGIKYIWIYFVYAPTPREFRNITEVFENKVCGIIEFNTQQEWLFKNHCKLKANGVYEWIRVYYK